MDGSDDLLRKLIDRIPTLAWSCLPDGSTEYLNRKWLEYTGLSLKEALGWGWKSAIHPEDLEPLLEKWLSHLAAEEAGEAEARLRRFDGEYRWFLFRAEPARNEQGGVSRWYGTNTDIEDRKQAEAKIRQGETEFRQIFDAIPQLVSVLSVDGKTLYVNHPMLDFTGLSQDEVRDGAPFERIVHPDDRERLAEEMRLALSGGEPFRCEHRLRGRDGRYRWFLAQFNPLRDIEGQPVRWYVTRIDIEERKLAEKRLRDETLALREDADQASMSEEIVGSSEPLRAVLRQVAGLASSDSAVLILGEPGTGKELVARAIHRQSGRAGRAFLRVDCAALPPSLAASELFGHEKGAFAGALQRRVGRFEAADGGTVFLDGIESLPMETQAVLLKALRERSIQRIGGDPPIPVDVRVLASADCDMEAEVAEGRFLPDLLARLGASSLRIPPLRERADDIPLLVEYFVERYSRTAGKRIRTVGGEVLALFQAYEWPGNDRELRNVVERAVILGAGDAFAVDEAWLRRETARRFGGQASLVETLSGQEREMIEAVLAECRGRISGPSGAAARLGIPRQTLESKIRRLGINKYRFKI